MKHKKIVVCAFVIGVVGLAAVWFLPGGKRTLADVSVNLNAPTMKAISMTSRKTVKKVSVFRTKPVLNLSLDDDDGEVKKTPEEKRLASQIEKALDEEDLELAKACSKEAVSCRVAEIRQAMVDTLGWFGAKTLSELMPFMADIDADVAESACNEWEVGVSEIEDDAEKLGMVCLVMQVMKDEDFLESVSGEFIGVDEKLAVEFLLKIIEGRGTPEGVNKAKETYEFVTGEEFVDRAEAERWVAEEYQPREAEW